MKKRIFALLGLSLACGLAVLAQSVTQQAAPPAAAAHAESAAAHMPPPPPTKVAIIQAQAALLGTRDGQRAKEELDRKMEPTKVALDKKATAIRELQDKLQRGGNAMADTAKAELTRNIEQMTKSYNRDMEDAQAEAQTENQKVMDELSQKITKVIDNYAVTNGYTLILDVSNPNTPVLYASTSTDITSDIIALYDKTYPSAAPASTSAPKPPASSAPKPPASTPVKPATPKKQP